MGWNEVVASVFLILGGFFAISGGIGILRLPDFYTRLHPAGKNDTMGQFLLLVGLMFLVPWGPATNEWLPGAKLVLMTMLVLLTAPTATHAITKAAWLDGLKPWGCQDEHPGTAGEAADDAGEDQA